MVPAAAPSPLAMAGIEKYIAGKKRELQAMIRRFISWVEGPAGANASPLEMQRRFVLVRLRFNLMISHFDIFADVVTQRSENITGVWLSGLDSAAADALKLPPYYDAPPVVCYLDRGQGAAIRRARTRLPGGGENPVAVVRVPRERMVGSGIASSLVHEVGHQAAALLDLVRSLRFALHEIQRARPAERGTWILWERWISEIIADFWSIARVGITSTVGLMGVVSLPRAFVFRISLDDPHPPPWLRVKLSCAIGAALYPHPQWKNLSDVWSAYYPLEAAEPRARALFEQLLETMDDFVSVLVHHRPKLLRGNSLAEAMQLSPRNPQRLTALWAAWQAVPEHIRRAPPSLVFAVIGQARANGNITPEREAQLLSDMLTWWAMSDALDVSAMCAEAHPSSWRLRLAETKRQLSFSR
jgi:hypothetical protein